MSGVTIAARRPVAHFWKRRGVVIISFIPLVQPLQGLRISELAGYDWRAFQRNPWYVADLGSNINAIKMY